MQYCQIKSGDLIIRDVDTVEVEDVEGGQWPGDDLDGEWGWTNSCPMCHAIIQFMVGPDGKSVTIDPSGIPHSYPGEAPGNGALKRRYQVISSRKYLFQ